MSVSKKKVKRPEVKISKVYEYLLLFIFAVFVIMLSTTMLNGEDDLFWHMATGRFIVENKYIPHTDVFGHVTDGMQWIPFEWLWDTVIYSVYSIIGFTGLYVVTYILVILIFYLLYLVLKKFGISTSISILSLFIIALGIKYRIGIKPQMISYLFFVLVIKLISDYKYFSVDIKKLYYIPLIFLVWANVHMGVIAGFGIWGIFLISEIWSYKNRNIFKSTNIKIPDIKSLKTIGIITVLSLLAMLINPNHINTYIYSFSHTGMKMLDYIYEWFSPFHQNFSGKLFIIIYIIFLAGIIPVLYYSFKQKDYFALILLPVFAVYSLRAVRFTTDYILISALFVIISLNYFFTSKKYSFNFSRERKPVLIIAAIVLLSSIISVPGNGIFRFIGFNSAFGTGIYEPTFPVKMVNFIRENKINEIGKHPYQLVDNGGYFLWNFPGSKNFIDSRNLNDSIYFTQQKIRDRKSGYLEAINEYKIDYFMLFNPLMVNDNKFQGQSLILYLSADTTNWSLVYWDDQSQLFVKKNNEFKEIVSKYNYKYVTPYNMYYGKTVLDKAIKEDKQALQNEIQRKRNEEPSSSFLNAFLQLYGKGLQ
ncbi:MAG: hypothetical protein EHM58_17510 [Ignavibacteriae bacterium]|nr:MAG: hypothetical protein EHM58_17510 [Ignavibacteriota bacterium]